MCVFKPSKLCKVLYIHTDRGFASLSGCDLHLFCSGSLHSHWAWLPFMPLSLSLPLYLSLYLALPATCFPSRKAPIRLLSPSPRPLVVSRWLPPYLSCPPSYDGGPSHVQVQVGVVHGTVGRHLAKPVIDCAVPLCGTTTITAAKLIFLVRCCVAVRCKI